MRFQYLVVICLFALMALGKDNPRPILVTHSDFKGLDQSDSRTQDLQLFADGRVHYQESSNAGKKASFEIKLNPQKLQRLTLLINGKAMHAVPAKIGSQISGNDRPIYSTLAIKNSSFQQTITIENFNLPL